MSQAPSRPPFSTEAPNAELACSFCGRGRPTIAKLVAGPSANICNECVAQCVEALKPEPTEHRAPQGPSGARVSVSPEVIDDQTPTLVISVAPGDDGTPVDDQNVMAAMAPYLGRGFVLISTHSLPIERPGYPYTKGVLLVFQRGSFRAP